MTQKEALIAIARRNNGKITPADVVEEARDEGSVLHGAFTWDDRKAAEKWRLCEAQELIRKCRVTVISNGNKVETYAFVGLSTDRENDSGRNPYRLSEDVANDDDLLAVAERDVLDQLRAIRKRHDHLKRLNRVWKAIDEVA